MSEVIIYDTGKVYIVDSSQIYVPSFEDKNEKNQLPATSQASSLHEGGGSESPVGITGRA